jgi:recombination protein RecR
VHYFSASIERAIDELSKLPGIGRKSAQRLVFYLMKIPRRDVEELSRALIEIKDKAIYCSVCFNITDNDPCSVCTNLTRNRSMICVVEEANDVVAFERTGGFMGLYHVLGGALSPLDGIGPDDLKIRELIQRINESVAEIIIATNPNAEGEATALYLAKLIKPLGIKISRIARGIPVGTDIEYADEMTLTRAMEGRSTL